MSEAPIRLNSVICSIATAAREARRDPSSVTLVAASKGRTAQEIEELIAAGQKDFGESRIQEALAKWPRLIARHPRVRLHFLGRLQSNKAGEAVKLFDVIHSVDRRSLVDALAAAARKSGRSPTIYVQVNIGEEEQKGGVAIAAMPALLDEARAASLSVEGLMAIPPQGLEPSPYFALLAKLARRCGLKGLSMGMSGDHREAVMLGATMVRIGSALFEEEAAQI